MDQDKPVLVVMRETDPDVVLHRFFDMVRETVAANPEVIEDLWFIGSSREGQVLRRLSKNKPSMPHDIGVLTALSISLANQSMTGVEIR